MTKRYNHAIPVHTHIGVYLGLAPAYPPPPVVYAPAPAVIKEQDCERSLTLVWEST